MPTSPLHTHTVRLTQGRRKGGQFEGWEVICEALKREKKNQKKKEKEKYKLNGLEKENEEKKLRKKKEKKKMGWTGGEKKSGEKNK